MLCGKAFKRSEFLKIHTESVHLEMKNYKCNICDQNFYHKFNFKEHISRIHKVMKKPNSTASKLWAQKQANIVIKFANNRYGD